MPTPFERQARGFEDVLGAIDLIERWVADVGGAANAVAPRSIVRNAIERQLLVISEAAIRIHRQDPEMLARLAPGIDWPGVRGIGNYIRHRYDDVEPEIIADVLRNDLAPLKLA